MQRAFCRVVLALLVVAAAPCLRAVGESGAGTSNPAILRTDAFVAAHYDASTALVFFNSVEAPANLGVPGAALPQGESHVAQWIGSRARLRMAGGKEDQWIRLWPGGVAFAPKLGAKYELALGGNVHAHGLLSNIGYLPLCDTTWLVGLVSVDAADRPAYNRAGDGFVAYAAPAHSLASVGTGSTGAAIGPVIVFSANDGLGEARTKIEAALTGRAAADYANYMGQREAIYTGGRPTPLVHVQADDEMAAGHAHLSYTAQKIAVDPQTPRYYVRAVWKSSRGEVVYRISAWFTPEWVMESVSESEAPQDAQMAAEDGHILNLFQLQALPMFDQGDDGDRHNLVLIEDRDPAGMMVSLKRWTPGGLLPTGVYFANRCKSTSAQ